MRVHTTLEVCSVCEHSRFPVFCHTLLISLLRPFHATPPLPPTVRSLHFYPQHRPPHNSIPHPPPCLSAPSRSSPVSDSTAKPKKPRPSTPPSSPTPASRTSSAIPKPARTRTGTRPAPCWWRSSARRPPLPRPQQRTAVHLSRRSTTTRASWARAATRPSSSVAG